MSQERRRPTRAPLPRSSASNSTLSIVIAVVAVVLGFFILRDIRQDGSSTPAATEDTTATETITDETLPVDTTVAPSIPLTSFKIQVANASEVAGSAGQLTTELQGRGYIVQPAVNVPDGTPKRTASVVMYLPGSEAQAALVAAELGGVGVQPMPSPVPTDSGNLGEASVLILLGTDIAGKPLGTPVPTVPVTAAPETTVAG